MSGPTARPSPVPPGTPTDVADRLHERLALLGDPVRAEHERAYLKSSLRHLGVPVPTLRKEARAAAAGLDPEEIRAAVALLWARPIHECRAAAIELLLARPKELTPGDLPLLERLLREARTWALVDPLAVHAVGTIVLRDPESESVLDRWATDPDFWIRRSALLASLPQLRRGAGLTTWARRAEPLLDEREFFIRKALGWCLRTLGERDPAAVHAWLLPCARRVSGLTFREATRKLPAAMQQALTAARAQ